MKITLNIGLALEGKPNLTADEALAAVKTSGLLVGRYATVQSDTEPTLVVDARTDSAVMIPFNASVWQIADALSQDCIAVYIPNTNKPAAEGMLIGPRAAAWGEFNPAYFIDIDGNRLA